MKKLSVDIQKIEEEWISRGFQGGLWTDPPGQVWENYIHNVDELVMGIDGEVEIEMEGTTCLLQTGKELLIPANTYHTVRNIGKEKSRWLYAYKQK
ncbi:MAG: cupin domain-containing protein [Nitrospiria bacterium]